MPKRRSRRPRTASPDRKLYRSLSGPGIGPGGGTTSVFPERGDCCFQFRNDLFDGHPTQVCNLCEADRATGKRARCVNCILNQDARHAPGPGDIAGCHPGGHGLSALCKRRAVVPENGRSDAKEQARRQCQRKNCGRDRCRRPKPLDECNPSLQHDAPVHLTQCNADTKMACLAVALSMGGRALRADAGLPICALSSNRAFDGPGRSFFARPDGKADHQRINWN